MNKISRIVIAGALSTAAALPALALAAPTVANAGETVASAVPAAVDLGGVQPLVKEWCC